MVLLPSGIVSITQVNPMHKRAYWICQIAGWSSHSLLSFVIATLGAGLQLRIVVNTAIGGILALLTSHLMRAVIRRRHWLNLRIPALLPRVVCLSNWHGYRSDRGSLDGMPPHCENARIQD